MKKIEFIKTTIIMLVTVLGFGLSAFGLNFHTGPIIEDNNKGAEFGPLLSVLPEGASFGKDALIYDSANPSGSTLTNVSSNITRVYQAENNVGYALKLNATSSYSKAPMVITLGVSSEGKITGLEINEYYDTDSYNITKKDPNYLSSFIGKDSALAEVGLVAGSTYSSRAFKEAIEASLNSLIENGLIKEGVKSPEQILTELIPLVHTGLTEKGGLKATEIEVSGNIVKSFKANNGSGVASIVKNGEDFLLFIYNALGACSFYNVEGNVVSSVDANLLTECVNHAKANVTNTNEALISKYTASMSGTDFEAISTETFNYVTGAVKFTSNDKTYYAINAKPSFGGKYTMDLYYVLDDEGKIVDFECKDYFYNASDFEHYMGVTKPEGYEDGFVGKDSNTLTDDIIIIAGATADTTPAIKQASKDVFAFFNSYKGGNQ